MFYLRSFAFVLLMCSSFLASATADSTPDIWTHTIPAELVSDATLSLDNVNLSQGSILLGAGGANAPTPQPVPGLVPLPASVWMMGSALIGLVSFGRRKQQ